MSIVPVIDLSTPIADIGAAIDEACRRTGFLQVINHGVDPGIEDEMWRTARRFFELPEAVKRSLTIPAGDAYGYAGFAAERLAASRGDETPADLKETYSVGPFETPDSVADDPTARFVYSPNLWPPDDAEFRATFRRYYDAMADLAARILTAMAVGLGLDADYFLPAIDRHTSAVRILHYPDLAGRRPEPGQLRAGAHSDYGTLTLLRQDNAPGGLEVRDIDGTWHPVAPTAGAYVVNVGDALERWTNDRWKSTLHRVVVPPTDVDRDATRQSIAFFHNANWDAVVSCLPTCCDSDHPPRYAPITAGAHLMEKFARTQSPSY